MKNRRVFLSGKVSGLPRWYVVIKFMLYDLFLTMMGYEVYNPVREIDKKTSWKGAMEICTTELMYCEYIYFQFDWWISKGSIHEMIKASLRNKKLLNDGYKIKAFYNIIREFDKYE
jgi:hypothetical protein